MSVFLLKDSGPTARGFSLIEVIVTVFVIGLAFLLYQGAIQNVFVSRSAKDEEVALRVASDKLEELRKGGYANLPASGSFSDAQLADLSQGTGSLTIADFNAETKQVEVTVSWNETSTGGTHSVLLSTLMTQDGSI